MKCERKVKCVFTKHLALEMLFPEKCPAVVSIFGTVRMKADLVSLKS